jgi:hypothetical protein
MWMDKGDGGVSFGQRRWNDLRRLLFIMAWAACCFAITATNASAHPLLADAAAMSRHPTIPGDVVPGGGPYATQDPNWLADKYAFRVRSNVPPPPVTGTFTQRLPGKANFGGPTLPPAPLAYTLPTSTTQVASVWEPSDGNHPNDGPGTPSWDDDKNAYNDRSFFDLCGPGAAVVTLAYWPGTPVTMISENVLDPNKNVTTSWNSGRYRGYMLYLAWQMQPPGWSSAGMMDTGHYPSLGTTLQALRDGMNWEISSHDASTWANRYYTVTWWTGQTAKTLHAQVVADVYFNSVPVIAEVNARMLPTWTTGTRINHFITIIGYNDSQGVYYYTDTCANSTTCGSLKDGGVHTVSQSQMWNAITNVPVNQSLGDGGWVW